jgi:hypothetical protein
MSNNGMDYTELGRTSPHDGAVPSTAHNQTCADGSVIPFVMCLNSADDRYGKLVFPVALFAGSL